jgi:hypothetical protein
MPGRGVLVGSNAAEVLRTCMGVDMGVDDGGWALRDASERGGDGGVAPARMLFALERRGEDAAVGDGSDVMAASDMGERGYRDLAERG